MSESEILKTLDRIWERSNVRTSLAGRLGRQDGTVAGIEVVGRPGYVYVSMGEQGDQGYNIAKDNVGVARTIWLRVRMRRELGELVIYEAASYQTSGTGGSTGGATSIFQLSDVQSTGWDTGEVMTWDAVAGKFKPALPGGAGGGTYIEGDGISFNGNIINAQAHPTRGIIVDAGGIGVLASTTGGLEADQTTGELRINLDSGSSGLALTSAGLKVGAGDGISISGNTTNVNVAEIYNPMKGLTVASGDLEVKLASPDSGLTFGSGGGLQVGAGQGIEIAGNLTSIKLAEFTPAGMKFDTDNDNGLMIEEGAGIKTTATKVAVRLSEFVAGLVFVEDFNSIGHLSLAVGAGDGIKAEYGETSVDVVELIAPGVYGMGHDGQNNFIVALEPNSGLRYNDPSGKLELGAPGDLDVNSISQLIDDTHYHHVATSSNPGSTAKIMATDIYGGFRFDTQLLYIDGQNQRVGINRVPSDGTFGASAALDIVSANVDDVTQRIKQIENQANRMWRVEDYTGQELIILDSEGNLASGNPGFVSGLTGWQITHHGNAEFNNIWARGELHATVFVKDEIHATGGTFMVATAATFYEDATISDTSQREEELWVDNASIGGIGFGPLQIVTTSPTFVGTTLHTFTGSNLIKLNHPPSGPATYFQPNEILRVKTEVNEEGNPLRLADVWLVVNQGDASNEEYGLYSVTKVSGSNCTIPKGTAIVTYGQPGDGAILMTSDWRPAVGDEGYAPYIDIFTTGQEPWTALKGAIIPHVRLGQLKGVELPGIKGVNKFGMIAGNDLSDANSSYLMASGEGIEIYRGKIRLSNGANTTGLWDENGNFKLGSNVNFPTTTGFEVVTTLGDPHEGDVWIGDREGSHYLHWNAAEGTLLVTGALQIGGGAGYATTTYVDEAEEDAVEAANAYSFGLFSGSSGDWEDYSDSRRMTSLGGSWTSTAYNVIKWGVPAGSPGTGLVAYFANNTSRTITDSSAAGLTISAGRTYLYVNIDASASPTPLTLTATQSPSTINAPGEVLIAVVDRGVNDALDQGRASINVMVGSTYISGGNIFTSSILAANIASDAITAIKIKSDAVETRHMSAEVLTMLGGSQVQGIEGRIVAHATIENRVDWSLPGAIITVRLANDKVLTITQGNKTITSREYAYVLPSVVNDTSYALQWAPDVASLPVNAVVIAVARYVGGGYGVSVMMTTGSTVLSGDDILTGTLHASKIVAGSIAVAQTVPTFFDANNAYILGQVSGASSDAMKPFTIIAMNGKIAPTATRGTFTWPQLSIRYGDNTTRLVATDAYTMTGSPVASSRTFFYVKAGEANSVPLWCVQAYSSVPSDGILLGVGEYGTEFSSVTMLYGGVYISGNSILAGSITANEIKAHTITVDEVEATFFNTAINTAATQATNEVYKYTVTACNGQLDPDPGTNGRITWSQFTVRFADYPTTPDRVVAASSVTGHHMISGAVGTRGYFWVRPGESNSIGLHGTTTMSAVPVDGIVIGVGELGETHTTVTMIYGGVMISGNHIISGSITAGDIDVGTLSAFNATTGTLTVDSIINLGKTTNPVATGTMIVNTKGKIYSTGQTTPGAGVAGGGFFMGYDGASPAGYKFWVGENQSYVRFDPDDGISIGSKKPLLLTSHDAIGDSTAADVEASKVFFFQRNTANANQNDISFWHAKTGIKVDGDWEFLADVNIAERLSIGARIPNPPAMLTITLPGINPSVERDAIKFTNVYRNAILSYDADSNSRLDWAGAGGMKLNGPLWVAGTEGNIAMDGKVFRMGLTTNFGSGSDGNPGDISITPTAIYVCVAQNSWKRAGLDTF